MKTNAATVGEMCYPALDGEAGSVLTSGRILVVDDNDLFLNYITYILKRAGHRVDTACDGEAGWAALVTSRYDLLITDYNMPRMTGIDLIRKVRTVSCLLPCILLSSEPPPDEPDLPELLQPGVRFAKSVSLVELFLEIKRLLKGALNSMDSDELYAAQPIEEVYHK